MKEKELREAIEGLEELSKWNIDRGQRTGKTTIKYLLIKTIQILKTLNEASGELGEKKTGAITSHEIAEEGGYNHMHDKASIVVAKYKLKLQEAEKRIEELKKIEAKYIVENSNLKSSITAWEKGWKEVQHKLQATEKKITELQDEILELKGLI